MVDSLFTTVDRLWLKPIHFGNTDCCKGVLSNMALYSKPRADNVLAVETSGVVEIASHKNDAMVDDMLHCKSCLCL